MLRRLLDIPANDGRSITPGYLLLSILFGFLLLTIASLYSWTRFYEPTRFLPGVIIGSVLVWLLLGVVTIRFRETLFAIIFVLALSALGLLVGSVVDFGRFGLQALADLCTPSRDRTLVDDMLRMAVLAPTASLGMLVGC